jgi:AcrR family transcriptional regulator
MQTQPGSRKMWLDAAAQLLAEDGIDAVKIMPLAKKIKQTRTGFYWYFNSQDELFKSLLEVWEQRTTEVLLAHCEVDCETLCDAVFGLMALWIRADLFDARLDRSVRNWALRDSLPRARLERSDLLRHEAISGVFERFGYGHAEASARADLFLLAQSGHAVYPGSLHTPEGLLCLAEYLCGMKPTPSESRRFVDYSG